MTKEAEKTSPTGARYRIKATTRKGRCFLSLYYKKQRAPVWEAIKDLDNIDSLIESFWRDYLSHLDKEIKTRLISNQNKYDYLRKD